ncbi:conserved hypothetical protein [Acidovorax delafieldii 2AN]|uniref:Cobalt-zinc-cadmium resistance protein n=1 Tax=Acidovorax delafieldii 2AN TaxID=573060 RepID=C5T5K6_ACIDE|nr:cation efflux protein, CzcI family [Acidovorax delafieldii]EER60247.1 conserved hypothetical protein [Acidovorax delafieldii 2AN]
MRRFLILFLLALLPFQFVWGAAASYCQHEQAQGVRHFGHHVHKHEGKLLKAASDNSTADRKNIAGDDDPDCASCHLSCVPPLVQAVVVVGVDVGELLRALPGIARTPYIPSPIERPNWTLAA